ncbi:MAG: DNA-3-methyladenine glycosylase 2 family protein [Acidobacteria bacterium]|nr:DNA-3-methyladenine glycosylase 2 family protein [Acidobacteriota bacterium]
MVPERFTPESCLVASRVLARRDPELARLMKAHGPCTLGARPRRDAFSSLVRAIVFQQLATAAATTIHARVMASMGVRHCPPPATWLATPETTLRAGGLSGQKLRYILDLCERVSTGALDTRRLYRLSDDEVIAALTQVKGIGRWTAEMHLMFHLQRHDVLPLGDLGVVTGFARVYNGGEKAAPAAIEAHAEKWRPYRSIGSWYMWRALEASR